MLRAPGVLVALVGLSLLACNSKSAAPPPGRLKPLDGTGTVLIDMNGTWEVAEVAVITEQAPNYQAEFPWNAPTIGATVEIDGLQFSRAGTRSLALPDPDPTIEVFTYLNQVDNRHSYFDLGMRSRPDPNIADGGSARFQIVFGSTAADEVLGLVAFEASGLAGTSNGLYQVRLRRR